MNRQNRNPLSTIVLAVLVALGALVLLSALTMPLMVGMMGGSTGGMMGGWGWGGGYWWSWLVMLLFWALLIGGVALVVAWLFRQGYIGGGHVAGSGPNKEDSAEKGGSAISGGPSALDILKQRYARGELTQEVYEQMKRDILAD